MAVLLNATGDSLGVSSAVTSGTYWAASFWFYPVSAITGGILGISNAGGTDYATIAFTSGQLDLERDSGSNVGIGSPTIGAWSHVYVLNDGSNMRGGYCAASGSSYTTASGTNSPVTTPATVGVGCYAPGDTSYAKNWRLAHVKLWSGSGAIPTEAQIQLERRSSRPIFPAPWAWWPLLSNAQLGDLSGNGRTLTAVSVDTADGPPVGWGAAPLIFCQPLAPSGPDYGTPYDHDGVWPFSSMWRPARV